MNTEMREKLDVDDDTIIGSQFENLLTVGSRIFFQTHFYPLIKMQNAAREIFLTFKGPIAPVPVLVNVEVKNIGESVEIYCGGMIISNRNRFEKELIEAKRVAEDAISENAELIEVKNDLIEHQHKLESQFRKLKSLKEQQQEIFKIITHDLQEPLRKAVFISDFLLSRLHTFDAEVADKLSRVISCTTQMREMLLTLQRYEEVESIDLRYHPVQLSVIVSDAIEELNLEGDSTISIVYPQNNPVFYADQRLLTHFFIELIRNSIHNRDDQKEMLKIEISILETRKNVFLESADKYQFEKFVKITYLDNGEGFLRDSSLVFQILQKSEQFNKISIGMAFCKRIVEKHLGTIVAKSVKGSGVGFTIFFPMSPTFKSEK